MNVRKAAEKWGFPPVGKLKRMPDKYYGMDNDHHILGTWTRRGTSFA